MFAFLAVGVSAGSRVAIGDEVAAVIFTVAWLSTAVTRLTQFRRGERPALQLRSLDLRTKSMFLVGSGPWLLLGLLQSAYPTSIFLEPIGVPESLRPLGIALATVAIVEPFLDRLRRPGVGARQCFSISAPGDGDRFPGGVIVLSGAILLLSGSPVFGLLCALWLGVALWRPAVRLLSTGRMAGLFQTVPDASWPRRTSSETPSSLLLKSGR